MKSKHEKQREESIEMICSQVELLIRNSFLCENIENWIQKIVFLWRFQFLNYKEKTCFQLKLYELTNRQKGKWKHGNDEVLEGPCGQPDVARDVFVTGKNAHFDL